MNFVVFEKRINRYSFKDGWEKYNKIESITKEELGTYSSNICPKVGDVILFKGGHFEVQNVIHVIFKETEQEVILEVKKYCNIHRSNFEEKIPLVTQMHP